MRSHSVAWLCLAVASLLGALFSGGCGGGGGSGSGGSGSTGQASVALTDAPSDRLEAFEVGIDSVELVLESGAVVSLATARARVDLTELVTVADLVAATSVPTGTYVGAILGLDLSQARVVIAGKASAARLLDPAGAPLTGVLERAALFEGTQRLVAATATQRHVELDLDLDASCVIDEAQNTVRLGPVLSASVSTATAKPVRLQGSLASVDSTARTFLLQSDASANAPDVLVRTTATTRFVVDGQAGSIAALTTQPVGAGLVVHGAPETSSASFTATDVVSWTAPDVVTGVVVGRTAAGSLSLRGATVERSSGQRTTGQAITVNASGARVTRQGTTTALTLDEVGVGQRVVARGALSGSTLTTSGASGGHLVLVETPLFGYATGPASAGRLTVNLARIGGRPIADFDFAVDATPTATPTAFVVNVSGLSTSTIGADTPVSILAQVSAWTASSTLPDAVASLITDQAALATVLRADWQAPTGTPFKAASSSSLTLDLQTSQLRSLDQGLATTTPVLASDEPKVVPAGSTGVYLIVDQGVTTQHREFDDWIGDLTQRLSAGARVRTFTALGRWDDSVKTLTARSTSAVVE